MAYYSLPIERKNEIVPKEYCYLTLCKYTDKHFQPTGKKLSAQELKEKKEKIKLQEETIKQLETGYCNLYNNKIKLDTIFDSFFTGYLENHKNHIVYRIKPIASRKTRDGHYSTQDIYELSEFEVVSKFNNKEEVIDQIYKDGLLKEFSAIMFDNFSYANEGYNLKLYSYFEYIKKTYPDFEISLSDIILSLNDYKHPIRSKFGRKDTYEITRTNIRYLLDNGLIKHLKEDDYYTTELIIGLLDSGIYDVALNCVMLLNEYNKQNLIKSKDFDMILRKWSTNELVKEIIMLLNITLSGVTLIVKKYDDRDDRIIETKMFDNIANLKTYLIKNYDIPFEKLVNEDISEFYYDEYEFNVN